MSIELDALVATAIFGYTLDYEFADTMDRPCVRELRDQYDEWGLLPAYSADIDAAWKICEHLNRAEASQKVWVRFHEAMHAPTLWGQTAEEAARCICEHALEALGIELPEETHA